MSLPSQSPRLPNGVKDDRLRFRAGPSQSCPNIPSHVLCALYHWDVCCFPGCSLTFPISVLRLVFPLHLASLSLLWRHMCLLILAPVASSRKSTLATVVGQEGRTWDLESDLVHVLVLSFAHV